MIQVPAFDPVIHAPGRLQICAILSRVDEAEFAMIREMAGHALVDLPDHRTLVEQLCREHAQRTAQHEGFAA